MIGREDFVAHMPCWNKQHMNVKNKERDLHLLKHWYS